MSVLSTPFDLREKAAQAPAERHFLFVLRVCLGVAAALLSGNIAVALWAKHELTQVDSIVALHSTMLATGRGLYYALNRYPFTVSPYGPIFYTLSACLHRIGLPCLLAGRLLSITALLAELWMAWQILGLLLSNRCARITGILLAAATWNLMKWGTVGQTDTLACCFSVAAFWRFLVWREERRPKNLLFAGVFVILALLTKQSALSAPAAIAVCLWIEDRRIAAKWIASVLLAAAVAVLALNAITHGNYYQDAVLSNMNPLRVSKLIRHLQFFLASSAGVLFVAATGLRHFSRRHWPVFLYTGFAACAWLATCAKIGSDANYQIETDLLIALCAACALDRAGCFQKLFAGEKSTPALLLLPLAANLCLNLFLSAHTMSDRIATEPLEAARDAQLARYLKAATGPVLSVEFGALLETRGHIDVEPLIYAYMVRAGRTDPATVLHDLQARKFSIVVLYRNAFAAPPKVEDEETLGLTDPQMEALRHNYRLVAHVPSPFLHGDYVYEPRRD